VANLEEETRGGTLGGFKGGWEKLLPVDTTGGLLSTPIGR
jgi:hypothetical protein